MTKVRIRSAITVFILGVAAQAHAGGNTNWAVPTGFDVVTAVVPGIMVYGDFGNPGGCTVTDRFFIPKAGNEQYAQMVATLMMAKAARSEISAYISTCGSQNWYSVPSTTFGFVVGTTLNIRN